MMMRIPPYIYLLVTATLLAGCSLSPLPQPDELLHEALPEGTRIPSNWQADADSGQPVVDGWLKSFHDPQLEAIVAEAMANNLDLRQGVEKVKMAQQVVVITGARLLPNIGMSLGARSIHDQDNGGSDSESAFAEVGWEADVWGKLRAQRDASEEKYQASALDYAFAKQSLAATVAKVWYMAIETRLLLELAEQAVTVFKKQLNLVEIRKKAGKVSDLDLVNTQANVATAESNLETACQAYSDIRRVLELLLGRYPAAEIDIASTYPDLSPPPATGIPASLLQRRPDIVSAERLVISAFRSTEAAKLALRPDFLFSIGTGWLDNNILTMFKLNPWLALASIGVSIPIYEGGKLDAMVEIATAQQKQAVANYAGVVLTAFGEIETALSNELTLARRAPLEKEAVNDRIEAVHLATAQYMLGRRDLLWVTNLKEQLFATQATQIKLQSLLCINRITLFLALGGSFDSQPACGEVSQ